MYGTSDNDIQLERPKEIQTVPPSAQDDQLTYQGLVMANGEISFNRFLISVFLLCTRTDETHNAVYLHANPF